MSIQVQYDYDGYGVLARTLKQGINFNDASHERMAIGFPHEIENAKSKIVGLFTMFESDTIPPSWVGKINANYKFLIVPSHYCRDIFWGNGVTVPIYIVPLFASDFTIYNPPPLPFTFGHQNSFIEGRQKGWDLVIKAFVDLALPDAKLLLKSRKSHLYACNKEWIAYAESQKNIEIIIEDYDDHAMHDKFYSRLNCFVYPSRGEGFGLPPVEAMAHGVPTILTHGHSMAEFSHYGIPVSWTHKVPCYYVGRVQEDVSGEWVEPNIEELKAKMKDVYLNYQKHKARAGINAKAIKSLYNKDRFLLNYVETVDRAITAYLVKPKQKVLFIVDYKLEEYLGGAQLTNDYLLMKAPVEVQVQETKIGQAFPKDKLIIVNSLIRYTRQDLERLIKHKNYIIFDHNYSFCQLLDSRHTKEGDNTSCTCPNKDLYQRVYNHAKLLILMSPLHKQEFETYFKLKNVWLCPSAINTNLLYTSEGKRDIKNLSLMYPYPHKGMQNVVTWGRENGEEVVYLGNPDNDTVLSYMRRSENFIFKPAWIEPFGRVAIEAMLSGCNLVSNERVGALSYDWDYTNLQNLRDHMDDVPYDFWTKVLE